MRRSGLKKGVCSESCRCWFPNQVGNQTYCGTVVDSIIFKGHFKRLKESNIRYQVYMVKQLRLSLDLKRSRQFGDVLCNLFIVMHGTVYQMIAMEIPAFSETIISLTKYLDFIFYMKARLCQLVRLAPAGPAWFR